MRRQLPGEGTHCTAAETRCKSSPSAGGETRAAALSTPLRGTASSKRKAMLKGKSVVKRSWSKEVSNKPRSPKRTVRRESLETISSPPALCQQQAPICPSQVLWASASPPAGRGYRDLPQTQQRLGEALLRKQRGKGERGGCDSTSMARPEGLTLRKGLSSAVHLLLVPGIRLKQQLHGADAGFVLLEPRLHGPPRPATWHRGTGLAQGQRS